jgi:hypothetical protein
MEMDDLILDVASEITKGNKAEFSFVLLAILGTLISEVIKWFFRRYTDENKAAQEFVSYYNNMGVWRRFQLIRDVKRSMRRQSPVKFSAENIANSLTNKFQKLSVENVKSLAKQEFSEENMRALMQKTK